MENIFIWKLSVLYWTGTWWSVVDDKKMKEGKRLIFLGLHSRLSRSRESARNRNLCLSLWNFLSALMYSIFLSILTHLSNFHYLKRTCRRRDAGKDVDNLAGALKGIFMEELICIIPEPSSLLVIPIKFYYYFTFHFS